METDNNHGGGATNANGAAPRNGWRLVLLPLPFQGHINPMLQLANMLYSKGFNITILHASFNSPNPTSHPHFNFLTIPNTDSKKYSMSDVNDIIVFLHHINDGCMEPIRDCLARLVSEDPTVSCLITDAQWFSTQRVADELKLTRIVLRTSSISSFLAFAAFSVLRDKGYFRQFSVQELESEVPIPELLPLKVRDLPKFLSTIPQALCELLERMVEGTKPASAIIWNTFKELEEPSLPQLCQYFPNPHFLIGPFHKYFPASTSSLLAQDRSAISWLDQQAPKSVLYVSFGSLVLVDETEFLEIAWGLANSKQPFLWVVRPGSIIGKEWLEPLPDGFLDKVGERGYIVKWAPQQEVLAHPATGGFWTHNGWNSMLESICEGVPMICSPSFGDQLPNARYISEVWKVGVHLENRLERGEIQTAIKRLMVDQESSEMRKRVVFLKEQVSLCLKEGGSSYSSLEELVAFCHSKTTDQLPVKG